MSHLCFLGLFHRRHLDIQIQSLTQLQSNKILQIFTGNFSNKHALPAKLPGCFLPPELAKEVPSGETKKKYLVKDTDLVWLPRLCKLVISFRQTFLFWNGIKPHILGPISCCVFALKFVFISFDYCDNIFGHITSVNQLSIVFIRYAHLFISPLYICSKTTLPSIFHTSAHQLCP